MNAYETLVDALQDLRDQGYTFDFNLKENALECKALSKEFEPDRFSVVEVHRFEGMSSTDDNSILFVIECKDGVKGTLVDAYGTYADQLSEAMIQKLQIKH